MTRQFSSLKTRAGLGGSPADRTKALDSVRLALPRSPESGLAVSADAKRVSRKKTQNVVGFCTTRLFVVVGLLANCYPISTAALPFCFRSHVRQCQTRFRGYLSDGCGFLARAARGNPRSLTTTGVGARWVRADRSCGRRVLPCSRNSKNRETNARWFNGVLAAGGLTA